MVTMLGHMLKHFLDSIRNPSGEFTPVPFWFLNDAPDEEKIRQQLELLPVF